MLVRRGAGAHSGLRLDSPAAIFHRGALRREDRPGSERRKSEGLAAYKPQQAVVFDGVPTAASTYFIAFSQAGLSSTSAAGHS